MAFVAHLKTLFTTEVGRAAFTLWAVAVIPFSAFLAYNIHKRLTVLERTVVRKDDLLRLSDTRNLVYWKDDRIVRIEQGSVVDACKILLNEMRSFREENAAGHRDELAGLRDLRGGIREIHDDVREIHDDAMIVTTRESDFRTPISIVSFAWSL
ncbi:hypothetical protein C8R46DRAFT_498394 [Mycena filopes]|nr:hypothetical protein C8R46DRAFT_498394 [Mycena filopes]